MKCWNSRLGHSFLVFLAIAMLGACYKSLPKLNASTADARSGLGDVASTDAQRTDGFSVLADSLSTISDKADASRLGNQDEVSQLLPDVSPPVEIDSGINVVIDAPSTNPLTPTDAFVPSPPTTIDAPLSNVPIKHANGESCATNEDCEFGHCVDKLCCEEVCSSVCQSCRKSHTNQADGICAAVLPGSDPYNHCTDERTTKECGNDGTCDGKGACRKEGASHVCAKASCSQSIFTPAATCDGLGSCGSVEPENCLAFACTLEGCKKTCTTQAECGSAAYCNLTVKECATKKVDGNPCKENLECLHGFCTDGVCCNSACTESCRACTFELTGQRSGTCNPVIGGTPDPRKICTNAETTCGGNGTCHENGGCYLPPLGTACGTTCSGSTITTKSCDGKGKCSGAGKACANDLTCLDGDQCRTSCTSDTHCVSPNQCVDNQCQLCGGQGQACCGTTCNSGYSCQNQVCSACGGLSQPCCAGLSCSATGTTCSGGTCKKSNGATCTDTQECASGATCMGSGSAMRCCPSTCTVSECKLGGCDSSGACLAEAPNSECVNGLTTNAVSKSCDAVGNLSSEYCQYGCWSGNGKCRPSTHGTIGIIGRVTCFGASCANICYRFLGKGYCAPPDGNWDAMYYCDNSTDCPLGKVCCAEHDRDAGDYMSFCTDSASCVSSDTASRWIVCDPYFNTSNCSVWNNGGGTIYISQ